MYKQIVSGILFFAAWIFTSISIPPKTDNMGMFLVLIIFIAALGIGYFIASWKKGPLKDNFKDSMKYSVGISSLVYLLGHFFGLLNHLI